MNDITNPSTELANKIDDALRDVAKNLYQGIQYKVDSPEKTESIQLVHTAMSAIQCKTAQDSVDLIQLEQMIRQPTNVDMSRAGDTPGYASVARFSILAPAQQMRQMSLGNHEGYDTDSERMDTDGPSNHIPSCGH